MEKNYSYLNFKNVLGCLIFSFLLLGYQSAKAQCFYVQSILVDACNGAPCPGTATEGQNEMVLLKVGSTALTIAYGTTTTAILTPTWPNNPFRGWQAPGALTNPLVATLNSTIIKCGYLKEPVGGVLPANSQVLIITSTDMCTSGQSFASLTDTLYVIFQVAGNTAGHFANNDNSGTVSATPTGAVSLRTMTIAYTGVPSCSESVTYDRSLLVNNMGTYGGSSSQNDGSTVQYDALGNATYVNNGCQAPYIPITVSVSAPSSTCSNASPTLTGVISGPATTYSWTSNGSGTVSIPTGTLSGAGTTTISPTYSPGAGESGTITFTLTAAGACALSAVTNTVAITINPAPSPTITSSNGASICNGGSTVLTASGSGTTFVWNPGAHSGTSFTVSPVSTQIYTVAVTNTCGTTNATYTVTVNSSPTYSLVSNSYTLCNGGSQTFTVSGASTYTWTPSATLTNANTANPTATPAATTVYSVTGTSAGGCTNATPTTITVTINPVPTLTLTASSATVCSSGSETLTANGANTYTWSSSAGGGLSGTSGSSVMVTPTSSPATYTVVGTTAAGCQTSTKTTTVTIVATPTIGLTQATFTTCLNAPVTFTASGATSYTWTPTTAMAGSTTATPTVTPSTTTTTVYSVTGTSGGCTSAINTVTLTVNPLPTYSLTSNSYTICNGSSQTFTVSGASTYTWTPAATLTGANTANPTATPATTTVYSVTGTTASGCSNATPATVTVTVNPKPSYTLTGNAYTICNGGSQTFTVSGASTYTWTPSATLTNANTANPIASPTTTTVYSVTGTSALGCGNATPATVTVTVSAVPTLSLTANSYTICNGASQTFTVSGASTYTWTPAVTLTGANTANPMATPTTTTIYTVAGTAAGCAPSSPLTLTLTVNPLPTYSLTSNSYTICNGSSQTFTVSGASTYTWTPSATLTNTNTSNPTASPTITTIYSVTGTSASGCTNATPATVTVTVNPKPSYTLAASSYTICNGGSQTFSVSGASSYAWTPAATLIGANTATPTASPTTTTVYSVIGTSALGCGNATPATVTVNITPVPSLSLAANSYSICNGGSQTFTVSGASTYTWTPAAAGLTGSNTANPTASPATTTVYTVTGTASGCASSSPLTLTLTVNPLPTILVVPSSTVICSGGGSSTLTASGASTYTWTNAATLSSPTGSVVIATPTNTATPTVYTVTGTDANNCVNKNTVSIIVNPTPTVSIVGGGGNSQIICGGGLINSTVSGITFTSTPSGSVNWTNNNIGIGVASSGTGNIAGYPAPTVTAQTTGIITASSTVAGCTSTNSTQLNYTITINPIPGETGDVINPAGCGLSDGTITGATGTGGSGNYSYEWNNTGGFVASSSLTDSAGTYPLQIKDNVTGCIYSQNFTISNAGAPAPPAVTPSSTAACVGGTVILTANPPAPVGTTYNWTEANGNTGTGDTYTVTNIPASPNPYTIGVTATAAGCKGVAGTTSITVNPLPDPAISSSTSQICQGSSTTLSVTPTGAYSYQWGNNSGIIAGATSNTLSVNASDTYSVTVTDNTTNCSASTSVNGTITVNPLPTIDTTGVIVLQSNCTSATGGISNVTVTGAPTITYTWTSGTALPTGAVVANGSGTDATLSNVSAGVYCLNVTDGNTCQNSFCSVTVTNASAPAQPVLTAAGNDTTYCQGAAIQTLTVSVANSGTVTPTINWYSDAGLTTALATNTNTYMPPASLPIGTTTLYVAATSNGCIGTSRPITITILSTPTISINPLGSNSVICNGASVVINPSGATTYTLNPGNQTGTSFTVNPNSSTTYTIDGTDAITGCSNATTNEGLAPITVNPTPTISINPLGNNSVICNGASVVITPIINPNTAATYTLNPGNIIGTSFTVSPNSNITYTIDGTNSTTGCSNIATDAASVPITVNPTPTISINPLGSNSVICNGASVVITPGGANTYTLNPGNLQSSTDFTVTPGSSTTYTISGSNSATGCTNAIPDAGLTSITVNPTPTISIAPLANNGVICNGSSVVITPSVNPGSAASYTLNPGNQTGTSFTVSPTSSTTYTINATDGTTGCSNAAADAGLAVITVNPTPTISINPLGSNSVICSGASVVITPSMNPISNSPTYTLNPGGQVGTSFNISPTSSTTYTINGTDGTTGCSNATADAGIASVIVNQTPILNLTGASIDTAKCNQSNGGVSNISASNVSGGLAPYNYQWTNTSTGAIVSTSPSFTNQPNGTYSLQVTDANGCVANITGTVSPTFSVPLLSVTASFITNPNPAVGIIPLAISFSNTSVGAINYIWSFGDGNTSTAINPTDTYTNVGTYSVVLAAINGTCSDTFRITVIANIPTTIIIPNVFSPNGDGVNDEFFIPNTGMASLNCDIYNRWGQLLHTLTAPNQSWDGITPNGDKAPEGTYMYILEAKGLDGQTFKQQGTLMLIR